MKKYLKFLIICILLSPIIVNGQNTNTTLGENALPANSARYHINSIDVTNHGNYVLPTLDLGGVNGSIEYLDIHIVNGKVECYGTFSTSSNIFNPSLIGGLGAGASLTSYLYYTYNGINYYEFYTSNNGTGYGPIISITGGDGEVYLDYYIFNGYFEIYTSPIKGYISQPTVNFSFGSASAVAILNSNPVNGNNTAIGYQSLKNTTGNENSAFGASSGTELTTGTRNTFIGTNAGLGITTGSNNTIIGRTSNLPINLNNTVILADGNGNSRFYSPPSGNVLIGYGSNPLDNGYKLDVNGNIKANIFTTNTYSDWVINPSVINNNIITSNPNQIIQAPTSNAFTDLLAFNKKGYNINYETSVNLTSFTPATLDKSFFSGKNGTSAQKTITDGTTKAVRWTFEGVIWDNSKWLALEWGYASGYSGSSSILIEGSSDGTIWSQMHLSNYNNSTSGQKSYHYLNRTSSQNFIRLTISNTTYATTIRLCGIKLLTQRIGNQGSATEFSYPYTWNKDGWIGISKGISDPEFPLDVNGEGRFVGNLSASNLSGTNTGDETQSSIISKLGFTPVSNSYLSNYVSNNGIGDYQIASTSAATNYSNATLELRESNFTANNTATPPRLGFHWGGVVASQLGIESDGSIAVLNNPGTGYERIKSSNFTTGNTSLTDGFLKLKAGDGNGIGFWEASPQEYGIFMGSKNAYGQLTADVNNDYNIYFRINDNKRGYQFITGDGNITAEIKPGAFNLKGIIKSKEVKVQPDGWADFVFLADYELMSLSSTEKFIKQFGHLPNIPSGKDVEEKGLELGDISKKLLQKIEELTLHMIELKKENELIKAKLQSLENK